MPFPSTKKESIWLIVLLFNFLKTEDPLSDINWKRSTNGTSFAKYWLAYVHKSIERVLSVYSYAHTTFSDTAKHITKRSGQFYFYFGKIVHPKILCYFKKAQTKVAPLFKYIVYWTHIEGSGAWYSAKYHRNFILHSQLRLNLTFIKLKLRKMFGQCFRYKLIVQSFATNGTEHTFIYCGIHSQFTL